MNKIIQGDSLEVLRTLDSESVDCCITSPPYWQLRDYGVEGQLGLEPTFNEYIGNLVTVFNEVKRVLKPEGTLWVNLGDSYSGSGRGAGGNPDKCKESFTHSQKPKEVSNISSKSLCLIPSRFAIAMVDSGWILRNDIIWKKPNAMPESVTDRFTNDYEHLLFFTKKKKYYFKQIREGDAHYKTIAKVGQKRFGGNTAPGSDTIREDRVIETTGRNKRSVWTIPTKPSKEKHYASYPVDLVKIPIDAGCPQGGLVLDPFCGTATTCVVAKEMGRNYIGIDLNPEYCDISNDRLKQNNLL